MACVYFKYLTFLLCLDMCTPSVLHRKPCFVQSSDSQSSQQNLSAWVTVSAQMLQSAGWCLEQVLRERISWSPRSY